MVLYSLFGHQYTSTGQPVVVNNTTVINNNETTVVPDGSRISGFGDKKSVVVPTANGNQVVAIPPGSTFTQTDEGMLITTPDGTTVLVPSSSDTYKADSGYQVPPEAQQPMQYDPIDNIQ